MRIGTDQLQAVLRRDFHSFIARSFSELNPQTDFGDNWHIEIMAQELELCRRGETRRLIVNLPPRSLKSHCISIAFVAWLLGHNPSAQIICASYAQELADKHALDCRALMNSSFYQQIFPTRLSSEKRAISDFLTTARGSRKATSVGGVLTGRGADFIVIDDPLQPDKALSDVRRKAVNDWYDNTLSSRLNHKLTGSIVIVMQRLHEDDLVGHVLDIERRQAIDVEPKWKLLRFPAIAEQDERYEVQRLNRTFTYTRRAGEVLHPQREPLEVLEQMRETQGEYNFAGQYQQAPAPLGGGIVKAKWFRSYTEQECPERWDVIFQSWDTANKASELSDYSVCTTWGVRTRRSNGGSTTENRTRCGSGGSSTDSGQHHEGNRGGNFGWGRGRGGDIYLLHVLRRRMEYPELKRQVRAHAAEWAAKNILIEDRASGTQLCQELIQEGMHGVTRCQSKLEKTMRMHTISSTIENGFVHLPEKAPWLAQYLHELVTFPNGKYDDQADSTSQALNWLKERFWEPAIITFYREEAERNHLR